MIAADATELLVINTNVDVYVRKCTTKMINL